MSQGSYGVYHSTLHDLQHINHVVQHASQWPQSVEFTVHFSLFTHSYPNDHQPKARAISVSENTHFVTTTLHCMAARNTAHIPCIP